jgi:hypothetical protein
VIESDSNINVTSFVFSFHMAVTDVAECVGLLSPAEFNWQSGPNYCVMRNDVHTDQTHILGIRYS